MKSSISCGVGGNPIRSKYTRRMSARFAAGGAGDRPFASSLARMKLSMGFFVQSLCLTAGMAGGFGLEKSHAAYGLAALGEEPAGFISSMAAARAVTVASGSDPPIGIFGVFSPRTYWISKLEAEEPGVIAPPCLPPFRTLERSATESDPAGVDTVWQDAQ